MPWRGGNEVRRREKHFHRPGQARRQRPREFSAARTATPPSKSSRIPPKSPKCNAPPAMRTRPKSFPASAHSILGESACASCHGSVHELTTAEKLIPGKCTECHADEVKDLASSIHGQAAKKGDKDAPKCVSCHGPIHAVKASSEAGLDCGSQESGGYLREMPQRCRVLVAAQHSRGASGGFL